MAWMRRIGSIQLLLVAYLMGVAGTLWDWREHFLGVNNQATHLVINVGGLLAIGVLAFTGWAKIGRTAIMGVYVLIGVVALITFAPFVLMMTARHSLLMATFMQFAMTGGALSLFLPVTVLSSWAALH